MKKMNLILVTVMIGFFLFFSCDPTESLEQDEKKPYNDIISRIIDNSDTQAIPFRMGAVHNHISSTTGHELFTVIRSKEELNQVTKTRYYQFWTSSGGPYNVYYLAEMTEKYDERFFAENALILYLFGAAHAGGIFELIDVLKQGEGITIITDFHEGDMAAISYWTVVIEVTQADIYGVTVLGSKNICVCPDPLVKMIVVVLTHEATVAAYHANKNYTPADFTEFNFSRVENLFTMTPTSPHFKRILFLFLDSQVDQNDISFLRAVELIRQRPDVEFVS